MNRSFANGIFRGPAWMAATCLLAAAHAADAENIPEPDLIWYGRVINTVQGAPVRLTTGTLTWNLAPVGGGTPCSLTVTLTNLNDQFSYVARFACESAINGAISTPNRLQLTNPPITYDRSTVTWNGSPLTIVGASPQFTLDPSGRGRIERIDLSLSVVESDSDGDGLPDSWENQYFPQGGATPTGDPDGDGVSNLDEYLAGTVPTDPNSLFAIVSVSSGPSGFSVTWSSSPGRTYRLLRSSQLTGGGFGFQLIKSGIAATPPTNTYLDSDMGSGTTWFYRVQLDH